MNRNQRQELIQNKIICFIKEYFSERGYAPSLRDISCALGIKSISTVHSYVDKLNEKGLLNKTSQKNRALSVNVSSDNLQHVPLLGTVTAGEPILAEQNFEESYDLPKNLFYEQDIFMLKIKGSSMIGAGIFDGDKIVVRPQANAKNGDIVVAIIDDDTATVKRYEKRKDKIILKAENPEYSDIISDNIRITGIVIGLIRHI